MLDWKILAAGFVALLFVSSVLVGNFGLRDLVSKVTEGIEDLFGGSPITGFAVATPAGSKEIELTLNPLELAVSLEDVDLSFGTTALTNFAGTMELNFAENTITFKETNSRLKLSLPAQKVEISRVTLKKFATTGVKFLIKPNIFSANGSLELTDFSGAATVDAGSLKLLGNVSKARVILEGNQWELV